MGQILYTVHGHTGKVKSVNFNIDGDYFCSGGEDSIVMVWKSNIKNMDEEYNTLSKARMQNYTMSNKTKINLEESKQTADKNYLNNIKLKLEGGENIIKPAKIPNKAFGMRYKVTLEKGVKDIFNLNQNNTKNSNMNNTNIISNNNVNISSKNNIAYSNSNMNSKNNVVIEVSENPMNDSSMMLNPNLNPFSKLPTEMASAFDKMIHQFEIISKTVKIMDQRIATAESQIEGLYGMRKIQNELNNDNNEQEYIPPNDENINNNNNNNYIGDNQYNENYNENINENNNIVVNNEQMVENNYINNEVVDNNNINENNNEILEQNENNNQIIENDINQNQINDNMISTNNNIINNINKNMTANFNGTITGLQASIGDLDINVNDAKNIFNQNLGNTNLNMENHEEINQNLNSNVNPIGSGEIVSEKQEVLNDVENNENNNENQEENK